MPHTGEEDALRIAVPQESVHVRGEALAQETFLARLAVHHEKAVPVGLVAVALHALPGNVFAVGRVLRIGVVSFVLFGDVTCLFAGQVVDVDVRVGGNGIFQSCLFTAGIGHFLAVGAPGELFDTAKRFHRAFVRFALQDVCHVADGRTVEVGYEGVWGSGYPFVPMLVHEVGDDDTCCLIQVGIFVFGALHCFHLGNEKQLFAVGAEGETFYIAIVVGQLLLSASVGIHFPYLAASAFGAEVGQFLTAFYPGGLVFAQGTMGDLRVGAAVGVHDKQFAVTLVLRYAVVSDGIGYLLTVGRGCHASDASHGPQGFGCHTEVFDTDVRTLDEFFCIRCIAVLDTSACSTRHGCCHKQKI